MATKKTYDDLDYTNQPQATTQQDVNNQDSRTRLWQSLGYGYNNQKKNTRESYNQAITQQDNALLNRGMQRSSYGMQSLANLRNKAVEAEKDIDAAWIADYQNRIGELEQQEKEDERWQQEFDYKKEQDALTQQNWQTSFDYQKERDTISDAFQEKQWQAQMDQWREEFDYNKMSNEQKISFEVLTTAAQQGKDVSDALLKSVGISRQDYNAMKKKSSSGRSGAKKTEDPSKTGNTPNAAGDTAAGLAGDIAAYMAAASASAGMDRVRNDNISGSTAENGVFSWVNNRLRPNAHS